MDWSERVKLQNADINHFGLQISMALIVEVRGQLRPIGTAFSVAPGLAITAAHVVDFTRWSDGENPAGSFPLIAFHVFENKLYRWDVDSIYGSRSYDIAFLRFRRPPWWDDGPGQIKPRYPRLNFNPPRPGDEIRMFGFPLSEIKDGVLQVTPSESCGRVKMIDSNTDHPEIPQQYAKVEAEILNGMSGGPCFDRDWNVIGVNGCGWSFRYEAYLALLWPAMNIEIDLFKSGAFPAIDLFTKGPAKALGYRRLHVKSNGQTLLANVDPDDLIPLRGTSEAKHLEAALNFSASNAQNELTKVRALLEKAQEDPVFLDANNLCRAVRYFFWELDSALKLALALAASQAGISIDNPVDWDQLKAAWSERADREVLDELAILGFSWYGIDLFEARTYAELWRNGTVPLESFSAKGQIAVLMGSCRRGGLQVNLEEGLDRFVDNSRRFVQRLLRLSTYRKTSSGSQ